MATSIPRNDTLIQGKVHPVGRILMHWLYSLRAASKKKSCSGYDTKTSDDDASVLELWGIWNTPSLSLLPDSLWSRKAVPVKGLAMGQIKLFSENIRSEISLKLYWITDLWIHFLCIFPMHFSVTYHQSGKFQVGL